jgi:hypothetical protein
MSPGPKVMSSPPTPVKLPFPVKPNLTALGECRCGGITSFASLSRYAVYMVLTVARRGDRPGLTRMSERRSESSIVTNSTARYKIGSISSL